MIHMTKKIFIERHVAKSLSVSARDRAHLCNSARLHLSEKNENREMTHM